MVLEFAASIFLALPLTIALATFFHFFDTTTIPLLVPYLLCGLTFSVIFADVGFFLFSKRKLDRKFFLGFPIQENFKNKYSTFVLGGLCALIILMGLLDLIKHGVVIIEDPASYATFDNLDARIRHISSLVWILGPIAVFKLLPRWANIFLLGWAVIFPILVLDRNRLLMALFALAVTFIVIRVNNFSFIKRSLISLGCVLSGVYLFGTLGNVRSGQGSIINSYTMSRADSGKNDVASCNVPERIPIIPEIRNYSPSTQWLIIYLSSPIYNLAIQYHCKIQDASLLKAQVIPLWSSFNKVGSPFLVSPVLTVGTEALPFFLSFGILGVIFCILLEFILLRICARVLCSTRSLISLIIFIRLAYCAAFFAFAPQFFLWTTGGLILVMLAVRQSISLYEKIDRLLQI